MAVVAGKIQRISRRKQDRGLSELEDLLHKHARESSALASQLAVAESELISFSVSGEAGSPSAVIGVIERFERVRRSATSDLSRAALLLDALARPPAITTARVHRAEVSVLSSRALEEHGHE
ncbi:MAG: hypothetical protein KC503_37635 [Myxococcales bacterium]|nr:hypothetical protein [Myxococcales bacterium]